MADYPSGTVTFLFTDIPGSTTLWERDQAMRDAFVRHLALLDAAIAAHGGVHFKTVGDATQAAFPTASAALAAAADAQRAFLTESWPTTAPLRVRMALHAGEAQPRDGDYLAPALNRLARLLSAGHGGQTVLTEAVQFLSRGRLPAETSLRDLGVHRLRDLLESERVFQLLVPGLPVDFPALRSLDAQRTNLPLQTTLFLGRDRELAEVASLLREGSVRLLTLTGPGGTGKTRLALQAVAELLDTFPDGVYFVPMAALTDPSLAPATIAAALALHEEAHQTPREQLLTELAESTMLLVLDNLEQIPGVGPFVAELLAAAPGLKVLAASRAPLRVRGEREYPVAPMPLPSGDGSRSLAEISQFDAVRLFVDRAQAVKPEFALDDDNAVAVAEIVRRLDGLPLAIELAAARTRLFPPAAMLARLDKRLPLLTGGARDLPRRQRALRETIAWSYDLLTPEEQALFRRLSYFSGGMTLDAAEYVGPPEGMLDTVGGLERLVEHSLLQIANHPDDQSRFRMLETIREFGLERLHENREGDTTSARHLGYFLDLAELAASELEGPRPGPWLDRLEVEHDNLGLALAWAIDLPDGAVARRLAAALWPFWNTRGHFSEGLAWLERVLARDGDEPKPAYAAVLTGAGSIARMQGDLGRATELLEQALAIRRELADRVGVANVLMVLGHVAERQGDLGGAGASFEDALAIGREIDEPSLVGAALINLGIVADQQGAHERAVARYEDALAIFRRLGDRRHESIALDNLGIATQSQGDLAQAARYYEAALAISRDLGDAWGIAGTLGNLGIVAQSRGDLERARAVFEESLAGFRTLGDPRGMANALGNLGDVARSTGDLAHAAALHHEALTLARDLDDRIGVAFGLEGIAAVLAAAGTHDRAIELLGAADALRAAVGAPLPPENRPDRDRVIAGARAALDDARFSSCWEAGSALPWGEAVAGALHRAGETAREPASR